MSEWSPLRRPRYARKGRGVTCRTGWTVPADASPAQPTVIGAVDRPAAAPPLERACNPSPPAVRVFGGRVDRAINTHCRALGTVGDSAEGPIGCAPGCVVKARPMDRRRFGHRGWANGRGVGPSPQPGVDRRHSSSSADAAPIRWATRGGIPVGDYTPSYVPSRSLTLRHTNRTKGDRTAPR